MRFFLTEVPYGNILFQVIFWKEFGFPVPFDRIMEFVHGRVGAAEAILRTATLLLTGKMVGSRI